MLVLHAWATIAGAMLLYSALADALTLMLAVGARRRPSARPRGARARGACTGACSSGCQGQQPVAALAVRLSRLGRAAGLPPASSSAPSAHAGRRRSRSRAVVAVPRPACRPVAAASADLSGVTACSRVLGWPVWRAGAPTVWRRAARTARGQRGPASACSPRSGTGRSTCSCGCCRWPPGISSSRACATRPSTRWWGTPAIRCATRARSPRACSSASFLAPYWVSYHLEHHLFVFVPCWRLRAVHALLLAKGYGARMEVAPSYVEVLRRVTSAR